MKQPRYAVSVAIHGDIDRREKGVPEWCDLSMTVASDTSNDGWIVTEGRRAAVLYLTREAGQTIIDATYKTLHPYAGQSIVRLMDNRLDEVVGRLLDGTAQEGEKDMARGMAMMIAIMYQPLNPDWEAVRDASVARNKGTYQAPNTNKSRRGH